MSRSSAVLLLTPLLCFAGPAQNPAPTQPEVVTHETQATFTSRVNLVSVPVVIRDKDGRSVGGLKQEEFQLFDKGKPQVITKFTVQTSAIAAIAAKATASKPVESAAPEPAATTPPAPELPDRYVAYFFDDIHMKPEDLLNARQAANKHLDQALDAGMRAGVFTTSGRTTQGFTDDVAELHQAVNRIQPWTGAADNGDCLQISYYIADMLVNRDHDPNSPLAMEIKSEAGHCREDLKTKLRIALEFGMDETQSSLRVLTDLIKKMSSLPGSRTIVLASPGFILTAEQRFYENPILEDAIRANVVINSLDVRGVYTPMRSRIFSAEYGGNFGGIQDPMLAAERLRADMDEESEAGNILHELADGTGGSVHDDNDLEGGLQQLAARPDYVYVLGFSPDNLKYDGSYHGLKVKLKQAGYDIEARRGYWAPTRAVDPAEAAREELKEAFFSRDELPGIPLEIRADYFKPPGGKAEIDIVARLDAKGLKFNKSDDRNNDTLTVVTGLFDRNGNYISGIERVVEMHLRDQSLEVLDDSGISVEESFSVAPGRYIVRVVVKDSEGQTTAAKNTGIEIP